MKKRLFLFALMLLLAFSLTACGGDDDYDDYDDEDETPTTQVSLTDKDKFHQNNDTPADPTEAPADPDTDPDSDPIDDPDVDPSYTSDDIEDLYGTVYISSDQNTMLVNKLYDLICFINIPDGFDIDYTNSRPFDIFLADDYYDNIEITSITDFSEEWGFIQENGTESAEENFTVYKYEEAVFTDYLYLLGTDCGYPVYYLTRVGNDENEHIIFAGVDSENWLCIKTDFSQSLDECVDLYKAIKYGNKDSSDFNVSHVEAPVIDDNTDNTDNTGTSSDPGNDPTFDAATGKQVMKDSDGNTLITFSLPQSDYYYSPESSYEDQPCYYSSDGGVLTVYYYGDDQYLTDLVRTGTEITVGVYSGYSSDPDPDAERRDTLVVLGQSGSNYVCLYTEYRDEAPAIHREIAIMLPGPKWITIYSNDIQAYDEDEAISLAIDLFNRMFQ